MGTVVPMLNRYAVDSPFRTQISSLAAILCRHTLIPWTASCGILGRFCIASAQQASSGRLVTVRGVGKGGTAARSNWRRSVTGLHVPFTACSAVPVNILISGAPVNFTCINWVTEVSWHATLVAKVRKSLYRIFLELNAPVKFTMLLLMLHVWLY